MISYLKSECKSGMILWLSRGLLLLVILPTLLSAQPENAYFDTNPMHWRQYWGRAIMDRNLIWCPIWNVGLISDSYFNENEYYLETHYLRWPGSQGPAYLFEGVFFTASLVRDMSAYRGKIVPENWQGDQFAIITSTYVWWKDQLSSDKTHAQTWAPIPGYYNGGGIGWTDGISEDINNNGILDEGEDINYNRVLDRSLKPPESILNSIAISSDKRTWPRYWPGGTYPGDNRPYKSHPPDRSVSPGPRAGKWNGEYGAAPTADQETFYRMDDHENDYYGDQILDYHYWPMKIADDTPDTRTWQEGGIAGAGIEVESRTYAWFHPLAEDILVSVYRIRNYSDYEIERFITGMWADVHVGGGSGNDNQADYIVAEEDYAGDHSHFDIVYQWHKFPNTLPGPHEAGVFGFAYLESPGIADNDIDDDADGYKDESMSNEIDDDEDWFPFSDSGLDGLDPENEKYTAPDLDGTEGNGRWDTEDLNFNGLLDPGEDKNHNDRLDYENPLDDLGSDGLGPDHDGWPGPDDDGTECNGQMDPGEPNFDQTDVHEADQAGLKYVYIYEEHGGIVKLSDQQNFWNTFFSNPLEGIDENPSDLDFAFHFGTRGITLAKSDGWKRFTIAVIMGENRDDAIRNKGTMQKIYDNNYHFLTPPRQPLLTANVTDKCVQLSWDSRAEQSKDHLFGQDFNGYRLYKSSDPKFLDIKTITDGFGNVLLLKPLAIFDKKDGLTGIHPVDFDGLNVSYDMGTDSGLEYSYLDENVENGRTYYYALTAIDAGNDLDFGPEERKLVEKESYLRVVPSESPFTIDVNELGELEYKDRNTAVCIPSEPAAGYREPRVDSLDIQHIGSARGGHFKIRVINKEAVNRGHQYEVTFNDDGWLSGLVKDYQWGSTTGMTCTNLTSGDTLLHQHYDRADEFVTNIYNKLETLTMEGMVLDFDWPLSVPGLDQRGIDIIRHNKEGRETSQWKQWITPTKSNIKIKEIQLAPINSVLPLPRDFELRIYDSFNADTSRKLGMDPNPTFPLNFSMWDITDFDQPEKVPVTIRYDKNKINNKDISEEMYGQIWDGTRVIILLTDINERFRPSWEISFEKSTFDSLKPVIPPQPGDIFRFYTKRNPTHLDTLRFTVEGGDWLPERAKNDMRNIYVVPDPYVVSNSLESIYELAGHTQRRVDFVNLPPKRTIHILTSSGKLVRTLDHNAAEDFGRHSWDLLTEDGSEIAFGVYFFAVQAKGVGVSRGKFAVIK